MESESESSKYSVPELSEADAELINSTELYNFEKQRIKIRVSKAAVKLCDEYAKKYAECTKDKSFSIVWACRPQFKEFNDCVHQCTTQSHFNYHTMQYIKDKTLRQTNSPNNETST